MAKRRARHSLSEKTPAQHAHDESNLALKAANEALARDGVVYPVQARGENILEYLERLNAYNAIQIAYYFKALRPHDGAESVGREARPKANGW